MDTHEIIKQMRIKRNLSQEYMAGELRMNTSSYCRIENGQSSLSVKRLHEIAMIFNINAEELMAVNKTYSQEDFHTTHSIRHNILQLIEEVRLLRTEIDRFRGMHRESSQNAGAR